MPTAIVTLPGGRKAKLTGPTREAVQERAQQLVQNIGIDKNTGQYDPELAMVDQSMMGVQGRPFSEARAPVTLPFGLGEFSVGGGAADAVRAASSIPAETSLPLAAATIGSIAAGPAGGTAARAGIMGALARGAAPVAGAGAGGAAGGAAAESRDPEATAASIAEAALESGGQMALAEVLGLGLGTATSRAIAPDLRFLDPLKNVRGEVARHTGELMEGRTAHQISEAWKRMSADSRKKVPAETREAIERLSGVSDQIKRLGRFMSTPIGGEIAESAAVPIIAALFGPGVALSLSVGKALLSPGPLQSYLSRSQLPNAMTRGVADQAAKTVIREQVNEESN